MDSTKLHLSGDHWASLPYTPLAGPSRQAVCHDANYVEPLPLALISRIVKLRLKQDLAKAAGKNKKRQRKRQGSEELE
jgi:hypothetical protein